MIDHGCGNKITQTPIMLLLATKMVESILRFSVKKSGTSEHDDTVKQTQPKQEPSKLPEASNLK